jgi:nicotinate (nicotinamide) nucleotide adenylyltransferase
LKALQLQDLPVFAVFGGSFNPVHEGHLGIVRALAADAELAGTIVVPARRSPFKREAELLPDALRWAMLRASLAGLRGVWLSDVELRGPAPSYTVDTLHALASLLPASRLCFALGWDAFAEFAGWHRAAEILALAGLIVFDRAGAERVARADPAAWARLLPAPWDARARPAADGRLVTPEGRLLVRHLALSLPAVAGREILSGRSLEGVPAGAREVLADYWRRAGVR